ncbi:tripartite tricarboxylate transporter permease [uncultured Shimia sp.]|uniref:tripartite tricarboxylate transporter permease n=1 Tax=uncultured Shimia sp. TaxID=573152 RepID=UPI00262F8E57|nr:tripartite tricarboxylate transporter permease [uncultured Shimia sp.]
MDLIFSSIEILARWDVLLALLAGSIGGVLIGAIPGVGPAVAIAILLPATFSMDPIVGLTVLLGIYGSSMYGGSIPAILINTPGTAVNALTTYDGYPMTTRGEARRALSLAYSASFFGGIFSVVCLILFAPILAKIAPMFGSREIFLAALLGLILVVVAHRGQALIAAALACFGIFLNTVGLEPVKYTKRFTFDQSWLSGGVNLIVVVLGLFALSQAFYLLTGEDEKVRMTKLRGGLFQGLRELARHPRVAGVSGTFGVLMGMIPGVGEFTAQFLSYTYAQKTSKRPQDFGHGSSEGLIAAETANNAVPAAAMVPLLALGIPGEALTAMMLSVFYVHNVVPGPQLFQNDMDFVVALYLALLLLNILVLVFLLFATNQLIKVVKIPNRFLGAAILVLSFVGVYSLRNSFTDCLIAACFGIFGFVLKRLSIPAVPIILGMVLGGIMEVKLRAGMARVKSFPDFFIDGRGDTNSIRPIAVILFIMIIGVLLIHFRRVWLDRKELKEAKWSTKHASTNFGMHLSRRKDYLLRERGRKVRGKHLTYNPRSTGKR